MGETCPPARPPTHSPSSQHRGVSHSPGCCLERWRGIIPTLHPAHQAFAKPSGNLPGPVLFAQPSSPQCIQTNSEHLGGSLLSSFQSPCAPEPWELGTAGREGPQQCESPRWSVRAQALGRPCSPSPGPGVPDQPDKGLQGKLVQESHLWFLGALSL